MIFQYKGIAYFLRNVYQQTILFFMKCLNIFMIFQMFEYFHDLKAYWIDGYAHEITYRQACLSMKNMFEHFG